MKALVLVYDRRSINNVNVRARQFKNYNDLFKWARGLKNIASPHIDVIHNSKVERYDLRTVSVF